MEHKSNKEFGHKEETSVPHIQTLSEKQLTNRLENTHCCAQVNVGKVQIEQ
jgi:hypothetical protein